VLKRTYSMTVIDDKFCLKMGAVYRSEPRFGGHAYGEWDWAVRTLQTL